MRWQSIVTSFKTHRVYVEDLSLQSKDRFRKNNLPLTIIEKAHSSFGVCMKSNSRHLMQ